MMYLYSVTNKENVVNILSKYRRKS